MSPPSTSQCALAMCLPFMASWRLSMEKDGEAKGTSESLVPASEVAWDLKS